MLGIFGKRENNHSSYQVRKLVTSMPVLYRMERGNLKPKTFDSYPHTTIDSIEMTTSIQPRRY